MLPKRFFQARLAVYMTALLALLGVAAAQPPSFPEVTPALDPSCASAEKNRQILQSILARPDAKTVTLPTGTFCVDRHLEVGSRTMIRGATGGHTHLRQTTPGEGLFFVRRREQVWIVDLELELDADADGVAPDCELPNGANCQFKRSVGVGVFGSRDVTLEGLRITGGAWGILLADNPRLDAPVRGLTGGVYWGSFEEEQHRQSSRGVVNKVADLWRTTLA